MSIRLQKIAAVFIGIIFCSGIVFAAIQLMRQPRQAQPEHPTTVDVGTAATEPTPTSCQQFDDVRLDSILSVVARHYGKRNVLFRDSTLCLLRLSTVWDREDSLSVFIETLNEFEGLQLTETKDTIYVQSSSDKGGEEAI